MFSIRNFFKIPKKILKNLRCFARFFIRTEYVHLLELRKSTTYLCTLHIIRNFHAFDSVVRPNISSRNLRTREKFHFQKTKYAHETVESSESNTQTLAPNWALQGCHGDAPPWPQCLPHKVGLGLG